MTLSEFKAWLEGFEEAMGGKPPSAEQWASIKAKLERVSDKKPVVYREAPTKHPRQWWDEPLVARL